MLMAFAMLLAVGMFAACSSSDDNNGTSGGDSDKTDPTPTPTATSGTLYVYIAMNPLGATWADASYFVAKSGSADNYKKFSSDSTALSKLKNAKLLSAVKKQLHERDSLMNGIHLYKYDDNSPISVDSVSITSFPVTADFKYKFDLVPDFDAQGQVPYLNYTIGYCFIDNLGKVSGEGYIYSESEDLTSDRLLDYLEILHVTSNITVSKSSTGAIVVSSNL